MKKVLLAAICCGLTFFGNVNSVEAEEKQVTNISQPASSEFQELSAWPRIRDSILGRDKDRDRDDRDRYRRQPPPPPHRQPPPPSPHRQPPPPPHRQPPPPRHYSVQQDIETNQLSAIYNEQ